MFYSLFTPSLLLLNLLFFLIFSPKTLPLFFGIVFDGNLKIEILFPFACLPLLSLSFMLPTVNCSSAPARPTDGVRLADVPFLAGQQSY